MKRGVFVTGTDTGVGKTLACCALIHALRETGVEVLPMKPIAAGAVERDGRRANDDSLALLDAAGSDGSILSDVTPILLREAMAPHLAARHENRAIALAPIGASLERLAARGRFIVVEGVGGFRVPLGENLDTVDLARAIGFPLVLVVGMRLGCLNHALLTAESIERSGLRLAGWIANAIDPAMAAADENVAALEERLGAPLLGRLPHRMNPDARSLARHIDARALLEKLE
ncbi:MAG TPA: dethiobiotin synthase [Usitatibacter sp.]